MSIVAGVRSRSAAHAVLLGTLIRELRESLGWSQSRLATALCKVASRDTVTREAISRWEGGKRTPGSWWLKHLATVLQVPIEILEQAGVDRRHFLTDVVGTGIAHLVASDLIERGFASALHGGYPSADDWGEMVDTYGRDYMTSGAGEIQKRLAADLVVLQQQLDTPRLWAVGAKLATLYGKTFPGSDGTKAVTWQRSPIDQETRTPAYGCAVGQPSRWGTRAPPFRTQTSSPSRRLPSMSDRLSAGSTP